MESDKKLIYQIAELFSLSQNTTASHKKNSFALLKLYENQEVCIYYEALLPSLYKVLNVDIKLKSLHLNRAIEFVGQFLSDVNKFEKSDKLLFTKVFEYLLQASQSINDNIRYRACQIITILLEHLVGSEISDELCTQIEIIFLDRLYDVKTVVRLLAIRVLYRLQDPQDPEDRIHSEFFKIIKNDTQPKVRELCVEKIILNRPIIEQIIKRTRDIDINVRLVAFKRLSRIVKTLKISDRRAILTAGIYDLSEKVQNFVHSVFLDTWLNSFDNDIFVLMEAIRYDGDEKDIRETLNLYKSILHKFYFKSSLPEIVRVLELDEKNTIPYEKLNWETVSYWRLLIDFLKETKLDDEVENVMPESAVYFKYVKGYTAKADNTEFLENQFIIKQLFYIIKIYDYSDPPTRQSLNNLVEYVLKHVDLLDDVVEDIVDCLKLSTSVVEKRSRFICEIISDLLYPIDEAEAAEIERERQFQLTTLTTKLIVLQGEQNDAIQKTDYLEADRLKKEIEFVAEEIQRLRNIVHSVPTDEMKKRTDLPTVTKCLDLACSILRTLGISDLTTSLKTLKTDVIEDFLMYDNDIVRTKAFKCYAIYCIFDKHTALNGIHMFALPILAYQAGEECDMQTLIVCIGAVVDLIRIYGADLIAEPDDEQLSESVNEEHQMVFSGGTSLTQLIQGLVDLMDDAQYEIQEIAGKGLCQLILNERVHSSTLLCKLILKWCNPADNGYPENEPLKQVIAYTLSKIPQLPRSVDQLQDVFMLTVRVLATAPKSSPLSEVDIDDIVKFVLALCDTSPNGAQLHCGIAKSLCTTMTLKPSSQLNLMYSRILTMLKILPDEELKEELLDMCDLLGEETSNKKILANLIKFKGTLVSDKKLKKEIQIESSDGMDED